MTRRSLLQLLLAGTAAVATTFLGAPALASSDPPANPDRLIVHEWGTFTVLQDEAGRPIGGINTDDEVLPDFVHDIAGMNPSSLRELPTVHFKAVPRNHPDVWTRLETPVTYFYPPTGFDKPIDVTVSFRHGWLTQYYPKATPGGPDIDADGNLRWGRITRQANGSLTWRNLRLGGTNPGPATDEKAWLAPRNVRATSVTTPEGERERYLFYRGVAHFEAPIRVSRTPGNELEIRCGEWPLAQDARVGPLLLVDAGADGTSAFRILDDVTLSRDDAGAGGRVLARTPGTFSPSEYSADNLEDVRGVLHKLLVRDGLYHDEATAMLDTWEVSYFKRPGLRLFFSVPRPWTEQYLPLSVSESADITRVMVGRIEIVTPEQRATLRRIAAGPASSADWVGAAARTLRAREADLHREEWYRDVLEGRRTVLESLKIAVPDDYKTFLSLGRFRTALVLDELSRRPTPALQEFVSNYQLGAFGFSESN